MHRESLSHHLNEKRSCYIQWRSSLTPVAVYQGELATVPDSQCRVVDGVGATEHMVVFVLETSVRHDMV